MGMLERIGDILAANVNDLIDKAEDPVQKARQLIREMDNEIIALRGRLRTQQRQAESRKRQLQGKQAECDQWQTRAERAVDEGKDDMARKALERKHALTQESKQLERTWWEAAQEAETLERQLHQLENQAQEARRRKESLIARDRQGRSSSDFIPVARDTAPTETKPFQDMQVDEELERLKQKRKT